MATQPFRTTRPTGSPGSGGAAHTLSGHMASNAPHPQFVKKGDAVGEGNLSGHEADPSAHIRHYLSRSELGVTLADFVRTNTGHVNGENDYNGVLDKYVVTTPMLRAVLGDRSTVTDYFQNFLSKWDVVIDKTGARVGDNADKVPAVAWSLFKRVYDVVGTMLYGISSLPSTNEFADAVNGTSSNLNPLVEIFAKRQHTHKLSEVIDPNTGAIAAAADHTHDNYAPSNHEHPNYLTKDDLVGEWLSREVLREVGIFEQSVSAPNDAEFNLNEYTTQGNYTFQVNKNQFANDELATYLGNANFPSKFIDPIQSADTTNLGLDAINSSTVLSVKSTEEEYLSFNDDNVSDYLSSRSKSKTFRVVQQMLYANVPVKRNVSGSNTAIADYKDSVRKIYSRTGFALDSAWYITSIVRNLLEITPKEFFNGNESKTVVGSISDRFYDAIKRYTSGNGDFGEILGYYKYQYNSNSPASRIRLAPEFLSMALSSNTVNTFNRASGASTIGNGTYLTRDFVGWLMPGFYNRSGSFGTVNISSVTDRLMSAVMPVDTGIYLPYLKYFKGENRYAAISGAPTSPVEEGTSYYFGTLTSADLIENKYSTEEKISEGTYAPESAETLATITNGIVDVAPSACIRSTAVLCNAFDAANDDPYLYELVRIKSSNYAGTVWSDSTSSGYVPLYRLAQDGVDSFTGSYKFREIVPSDGYVGKLVFAKISATGAASGQYAASWLNRSNSSRWFKFNSSRGIFERLNSSECDELEHNLTASTPSYTLNNGTDVYVYTGSAPGGIPDDAAIYYRRYITTPSYSMTSDLSPVSSKTYYTRSGDDYTSVSGSSLSSFDAGTVYYERVDKLQWNKELIADRPQTWSVGDIDASENVYVYDTVSHKFIPYGEKGKVPPVSEVVDSETINYTFPVYKNPVIRGMSSVKEEIAPLPRQWVIPKIVVGIPAQRGVTYVKFNSSSDVSRYKSSIDYTTGYDKTTPATQRSFVIIEDADALEELRIDKGSDPVQPSDYTEVEVRDPVRLVDVLIYRTYSDMYKYFTKSGSSFTPKDPDEIFDLTTGEMYPGVDVLSVYVIQAEDPDKEYILTGTSIPGDGSYGVKLPRYEKHLDEFDSVAYINGLFFNTKDTTPVSGKRYYTRTSESYEIIPQANVASALQNPDTSVYESITLEELFDIWCAINQLTTTGADVDAILESDADRLVYNFDSAGGLITWDAWDELVTHSDPAFAKFESRSTDITYLTDTMLPWLRTVTGAIDGNLVEYGFKKLKTGSSTEYEPDYDTGFDKTFKIVSWLFSGTGDSAITQDKVNIWLSVTPQDVEISLSSISYDTGGSGVVGEAVANSNPTTSKHLKFSVKGTGSTVVIKTLANLDDLAKYATGDWVLALQDRIEVLEANDPNNTSFTTITESVPVNNRKYYVYNASTGEYTLAGVGGSGFSFTPGVIYYRSVSINSRLAELEDIWEWFENNVQSGGGTLVINETYNDTCIDAFLNYDSSGEPITRGSVVNLNSTIKAPTAEISSTLPTGILVDTNLSGDITTISSVSYTSIKIMDINEGGFGPYQFSIVLKCDDSVSNAQNKVIENPIAEVLVPHATNPGEYQGAMYVPANSLLWVVTSGVNYGVHFKVPQSWVDLYNLGTSNATYHVYLRKRYRDPAASLGVARANSIVRIVSQRQ